jgi:hypothetical protein
MTYTIAYDVRDDSVFAGHGMPLLFVGGAILWTAFWVLLHRCIRGMPPERRRNAWKGSAIGALLIVVGSIAVATSTVPAVRDQLRCRDWLRTGDHQTVAGEVAGLHRQSPSKNPVWLFHVGETEFRYQALQPPVAGFRGEFTAPGTRDRSLRDGLPVRIAHRDGRILRIEIGEP